MTKHQDSSQQTGQGRPGSATRNKKPLRLLTAVPNESYDRLIVRYPCQNDFQYAHAYLFAALRLASTFSGQPEDDQLLLPFLTLYRQAFELQLKNSIRTLVGLRVMYVDGRSEELVEAVSEERFKGGFGHNLHQLLNEVKIHFIALDLNERFPAPLGGLVMKLHEADKAGTAFRYAGLLPETQEYADFPDLVEMLDTNYRVLCSVIDYAEGCYEPMPTLADLEAETY